MGVGRVMAWHGMAGHLGQVVNLFVLLALRLFHLALAGAVLGLLRQGTELLVAALPHGVKYAMQTRAAETKARVI